MRKIMIALFALTGITLFSSSAASAADRVIMFSSPGCGACVQFKNQMAAPYRRSRLGKKAPLRIVNSNNRRAMKRYKGRVRAISYTPTFVLMRNGREVSRSVGYGGRKSFIRTVKRMRRR